MQSCLCGGATDESEERIVDAALMVNRMERSFPQPAHSEMHSAPTHGQWEPVDLYGGSKLLGWAPTPGCQGECLIFLEAARNVPVHLPKTVGSQLLCGPPASTQQHGYPCVRIHAEDAAGSKLGRTAEWDERYGNCAPSWFSARPLGFSLLSLVARPDGQSGLGSDDVTFCVELRDRGQSLGSSRLRLSDIELHRRLELPLETTSASLPNGGSHGREEAMSCRVSLQVLSVDACLGPRTVYFIRHGQSMWNAAQKNAHVLTMASRCDHPLSARGRDEALKLAAQIANGRSHGSSAGLAHPDIVYVSPLTRAVQTAVLALGKEMVLARGVGQMVFMPNAREKKNGRFSYDSQPEKVGATIIQRTVLETKKLCESLEDGGQEVMSMFDRLRFDTEEVEDQWWNNRITQENPADLEMRMQDFMSQLVYSPHRFIVVVGHSHFFRACFKRFLSQSFRQGHAAFAAELESSVLPNCGVARVELDPASLCNGGDGRPLVGVELLFGAELEGHGKHQFFGCCHHPKPASQTDGFLLEDPQLDEHSELSFVKPPTAIGVATYEEKKAACALDCTSTLGAHVPVCACQCGMISSTQGLGAKHDTISA